jgi:hypothetical protein
VRNRNSLQPLRALLQGLAKPLALCALLSLCAVAGRAQTATPLPQLIAPDEKLLTDAARPAARDSELYCAGYIEQSPSYGGLMLVGGEQEQERNTYASGDYVYINGGAQAGVRVGQEFAVTRPRGSFKTDLSKKKGSLGVFTQEIGRLRVVKVEEKVSVARVVQSCEQMLLGDLLRPAEARTSPPAEGDATSVNRFADPTGKPRGHIVLARDAREMIANEQIVYVDLGAEDNLRAGDRLTVFRQPGRGRVVDFPAEVVQTASGGYQSPVFKGGKFSNEAQRAKKLDGDPKGPALETPEIKRTRPQPPRKVVGELLVLNVQGRTATAVVTRVAQELHTGDEVEVK